MFQKTVLYDAHYALRLCLEHHLDEACVHIYSAMGLYEEALDLALKVQPSPGGGGGWRLFFW